MATVSKTQGANGQDVYNVDVATAAAPTVARGNVTVAAGDENKVMTAGDVAKAINGSERTSSVDAGSTAVTVTPGVEDAQGNTLYTVDLSQASKDSLAKADTALQNVVSNDPNLTATKTGDTVTLDFSDDPTFNSVTAGPVTINNAGINAGNTVITNVAAGTAPTDAVNVSQLTQAVAAAKVTVTSNDKTVNVVPNGNNYDLSVNTGNTLEVDATTGAINVKTDGTTITTDANGAIMANTTPLTNSANGTVATPAAPNALATAGDIANAINNAGFNIQANGGATELVKTGETVNFVQGNNIVVTHAGKDITIATADDLSVTSVTAGNTKIDNAGLTITGGPSVTNAGINAGGQRITNMADGQAPDDAVTLRQLQAHTNNYVPRIDNRIDDLNQRLDETKDDANAGVSSAMAMAALPQAYLPGKSMLTGGMATYNGQGAVAVGFSKLSDNGRWVLKLSGSADTKGNAGAAVGAGFHF